MGNGNIVIGIGKNVRRTMMYEHHITCGLFAIYAGNSDGTHKTDCTEEALTAVRDFMINECLGGYECSKSHTGGYEWKLRDGRTVELRCTIKEKVDETKNS